MLIIYPVRCAHYPPPCLRGSLAHPVCQVSFAVAFPGFWDVKIMIFEDFGRSKWRFLGHFGRPGAHCGGLGAPGAKNYLKMKTRTPPGPPQTEPVTHFLQCVFLCFFGCSFFLFFCDFGCPETPFWLPFWLLFRNPGHVKKQLKLWYCQFFSRFGLFQVESFCTTCSRVRFDDEFLQILTILRWFEAPIWRPFAPWLLEKKRVLKKVFRVIPTNPG